MTTSDLTRHRDILAERLADGDARGLDTAFEALSPEELPLVFSRLEIRQQVGILELLVPQFAATLVSRLEEFHASELMAFIAPDRAAAIFEHLPSNAEADLLNRLDRDHANAILAQLGRGHAEALRNLSQYPSDTAGGLMVTEVLAFPGRKKVQEVIDDLRANASRYSRFHVQYIYVLGLGGRLAAVVRVRDLLLADPELMLKELTPIRPTKVNHLTSLDALREIFDGVPFVGLPVVDDDHVLVGVVRRFHLEEALANKTVGEFRRLLGIVGGEEVRTMPTLRRSGRRLSWLSVNILLNIVAASVIVMFEETLTQVIALAVFLPIISDMSGCSGNQAVAVSLRELSLGLVRTREVFRVWFKEASVGVINGIVLGALLGAVAWIWKGNPWLGIVVATAMAVNTVIAVSIGGTIPLILKRLGFDPALASGPILTTVTDMCGFVLALGLATLMLARVAT